MGNDLGRAELVCGCQTNLLLPGENLLLLPDLLLEDVMIGGKLFRNVRGFYEASNGKRQGICDRKKYHRTAGILRLARRAGMVCARIVTVTDPTIDVKELMRRIAGKSPETSNSAEMLLPWLDEGQIIYVEGDRQIIVAKWTTDYGQMNVETDATVSFGDNQDITTADLDTASIQVSELMRGRITLSPFHQK